MVEKEYKLVLLVLGFVEVVFIVVEFIVEYEIFVELS